MPNYIKNRIELSGSEEQIKQLVEKFSTHYEKEPRNAYDGRAMYSHSDGRHGWLDEKTQEFEIRDEPKVKGIPDGFEINYEDAFTRFPDFEKIKPMPESLHIESGSWLMPLENQFSGHTLFKAHIDELRNICVKAPERKEKMIDNFITGIRNYIDYGHATWYSWSVANWGVKWNSGDCEKESDNVFIFETAWSGVVDLVQEMTKQFPDVIIAYEWSDEDTGSNCGVCYFKGGAGEINQLDNQSVEAYDLAFKLRPYSKENYHLVEDKYEYIKEE